MIMEDDTLKISEEYLRMSVAELDREAKRVYAEIQKKPRNIKSKKKAVGKKDVKFFF